MFFQTLDQINTLHHSLRLKKSKKNLTCWYTGLYNRIIRSNRVGSKILTRRRKDNGKF